MMWKRGEDELVRDARGNLCFSAEFLEILLVLLVFGGQGLSVINVEGFATPQAATNVAVSDVHTALDANKDTLVFTHMQKTGGTYFGFRLMHWRNDLAHCTYACLLENLLR